MGFFLTIEGIEGSGKTTLSESLAKHFRERGMEVVVTAEPGGDRVGQGIRALLLDSANEICDRAELLLFEAARAQHVESTILPALRHGAMVICDRFADSSIAYQGYGRGIDLDMVKKLNDYAVSGLKPDLTILLDLPVEIGLARETKSDRVSSQSPAFHEAVRRGFLALAEDNPDRFVVIDASQSPTEVLREALAALTARV